LEPAGAFDQLVSERLSCGRDQGSYKPMEQPSDGIALAGKHSIRLKSKLRLLILD
jgi:hypothetical protein